MALNTDEIVAEQQQKIIYEMFIRTADDNYVAARYCYSQKFMVDFLWLSVHCLEKYMKAILLLNGQSAKGYGHDIRNLYIAVRTLIASPSPASDLLPDEMIKPANLGNNFSWNQEPTEKFVEAVYAGGEAENRYLVSGFFLFPDALFKLDLLVFAIRRLCKRLFEINPTCRSTNRQVLINDPCLWRLEPVGYLEQAVDGSRGPDVQRTLVNGNPWFAPPGYSHDTTNLHIAMRMSVLKYTVVDPLRGDPHDPKTEAAGKVEEWFLENIQIGRRVRDEFEAACDDARQESSTRFTP
jgi:hypothetical protein